MHYDGGYTEDMMSDEVRASTSQYLTFTLAEEQYAVEVYDVKEVLERARKGDWSARAVLDT